MDTIRPATQLTPTAISPERLMLTPWTGTCGPVVGGGTSHTYRTSRSCATGCPPAPRSGRLGGSCAAETTCSARRTAGPAGDAPLVPRGKVLRDAVILRLLAA